MASSKDRRFTAFESPQPLAPPIVIMNLVGAWAVRVAVDVAVVVDLVVVDVMVVVVDVIVVVDIVVVVVVVVVTSSQFFNQ